jgi:uncharacterized repeat protein (TIGR03803 family)
MKRTVNALRKLNWGTRACAVLVLCATTAIALPAQTLTTLHSFHSTDGENPTAALVQATDGNLYGTTAYGGLYPNNCPGSYSPADGCGTVFRITPSGKLTTLHSFNGTDGGNPIAGLIQANDGDFCGTTAYGGAFGWRTIFKITRTGTLSTLYSFCPGGPYCTDGALPFAGLIQATNGDFYGTTYDGGAGGQGTIFKITPVGTLTTLYSFCAQTGCTSGGPNPDGENPSAGLVQAFNGSLYGTTSNGGAYGYGTVFKITPTGSLTTLHNFSGFPDEGGHPSAGLVQATNGDFYGTTPYGGPKGNGTQGGTVFRITPAGTLTTLHSFCAQSNCTDGELPFAALVQATDGDFYGTTSLGGYNNCGKIIGCGTAFKITPTGSLTTVYNFCSPSGCTVNGQSPSAGLVQATNGDFYGTTVYAGANNGDGTVFSLSVGLGPFVETQPTSGKAGAAVKILGTNLTDAASVSFNGSAAAFTVVSSSLITTTVPAGASSGRVQVVTPSRTLSSNVAFRVVP